MESLETGKDKIKKICEILKTETLEPAKEEAQKVIEMAQREAQSIIKDAESQGRKLFSETMAKLDKEKALFQSSIDRACKQGLEALRQDIENKLFNEAIEKWVVDNLKDPQVGVRLISALVASIEKDGISADFSAVIGKMVKTEEVNAQLAEGVLKKLREQEVIVGDFIGGVKLKLHDKKLTLDLSSDALKETIGAFLRRDFRDVLFGVTPSEPTS